LTYFSKLDITDAFYNVRVKKGHEWKTAFRCIYEVYEYKVMPFGISNAPSVFQPFLNAIISQVAPNNVLVYLDDILIATNTRKKNNAITRQIIEALLSRKFYRKSEKC
jgi:Reverse transcriptase (RNA-dependent DNA polymerase)